jgi:hypothetical protein
MTPALLKKLFPPIVTGPTVTLIGVSLIQSGLTDWAGGATCAARPTTGIFQLCPTIYAPHALPWGSAEYIGLGFSVFVSIILFERFGAPIMKSCKSLSHAFRVHPTDKFPSERHLGPPSWLYHRGGMRLFQPEFHRSCASCILYLGAYFPAFCLWPSDSPIACRLPHSDDGGHW